MSVPPASRALRLGGAAALEAEGCSLASCNPLLALILGEVFGTASLRATAEGTIRGALAAGDFRATLATFLVARGGLPVSWREAR